MEVLKYEQGPISVPTFKTDVVTCETSVIVTNEQRKVMVKKRGDKAR